MKKEIKLGVIHIASWNPKWRKMFSYNFYYDSDDEDDKKEVMECDPKEIVLPPDTEYTLIIDYPVSTHYKANLKVGGTGMTRIKLADVICKHYRKMYLKESQSLDKESRAKYGIWGHDLVDLILCSVKIDAKKNIWLGVDS